MANQHFTLTSQLVYRLEFVPVAQWRNDLGKVAQVIQITNKSADVRMENKQNSNICRSTNKQTQLTKPTRTTLDAKPLWKTAFQITPIKQLEHTQMDHVSVNSDDFKIKFI